MICFKQTKETNKKSDFSYSLPLWMSLTQVAADNKSKINSERDVNYFEENPYWSLFNTLDWRHGKTEPLNHNLESSTVRSSIWPVLRCLSQESASDQKIS